MNPRRAAYTRARTIVVDDAVLAPPGPGQVRIDVAFTGICGTDLHIFHGDMNARVSAPAVLGHEMSGRIAAIGEGVEGRPIGDPVTVMPLAWCGNCPACRAGHSHICHNLVFLGIDAPGSMQGSWNVPVSTLIDLPETLPLDRAALVEPTAVAIHDVARAGLEPGEHALVVGGGPIGVLIALVARRNGAHVILVEPDLHRRAIAEKLDLSVLDPVGIDVAAEVAAWSGGAGAEVAFEVSGAAAGVTIAVDSLATRGRLVQVAIHPHPRPVNLHRFFWRELTLIGARLYERADFEAAARLLADGEIPAAALISRIEPIERAADAFSTLETGAGVMKVLIDCGGAR